MSTSPWAASRGPPPWLQSPLPGAPHRRATDVLSGVPVPLRRGWIERDDTELGALVSLRFTASAPPAHCIPRNSTEGESFSAIGNAFLELVGSNPGSPCAGVAPPSPSPACTSAPNRRVNPRAIGFSRYNPCLGTFTDLTQWYAKITCVVHWLLYKSVAGP